jgi:hypothetical protein
MTPTPIYKTFVERLTAALTAAGATFKPNDRPTLK